MLVACLGNSLPTYPVSLQFFWNNFSLDEMTDCSPYISDVYNFSLCEIYFQDKQKTLCPFSNEALLNMAELAERRMRGRPRTALSAQDAGSVQSLERAIAVLRVLADADGLSLTEVARQAELAPSTAYRMLSTLQVAGFAEIHESNQLWFIGVEAFRIGSAFLRRRKLSERGLSIVQNLMLQTGETANIALAERDGVVFVTQAETHEPIRAFFRPGTRGPYHASGIGKAALAFMTNEQRHAVLERLTLTRFTPNTLCSVADIEANLADTYARGYALDDEERHLGMRCIAAPVFDELGTPIGGVSVSGPTVRVDKVFIEKTAGAVIEAARNLTLMVGGLCPR
ncbi:MAG: IclR family transcriptional regulator [Microcystis sp. LE19-4.1E]|nr:IclR family transcriptional regulator [Microcystis sp. LE19-4.1E]